MNRRTLVANIIIIGVIIGIGILLANAVNSSSSGPTYDEAEIQECITLFEYTRAQCVFILEHRIMPVKMP